MTAGTRVVRFHGGPMDGELMEVPASWQEIRIPVEAWPPVRNRFVDEVHPDDLVQFVEVVMPINGNRIMWRES